MFLCRLHGISAFVLIIVLIILSLSLVTKADSYASQFPHSDSFKSQSKFYYHIPRYSAHKSAVKLLDKCNSTFRLIQKNIFDPKAECKKYSSEVIGFDQLMQFYYAIKSSKLSAEENRVDIDFPLRHNVESGARLRVTLSKNIVYPSFEVRLQNMKGVPETAVVCVVLDCENDKPVESLPHNCTNIDTQRPLVSPVIDSSNRNSDRASMKSSETWFNIALGLMIFAVMIIICVLVYFILSFYRRNEAKVNCINSSGTYLNHRQQPHMLDPKTPFDTINSFDMYDYLRKSDQLQCGSPLPQTTMSETYARPHNTGQRPATTSPGGHHRDHSPLIGSSTVVATDRMELLNNKVVQTVPLVKKQYAHNQQQGRVTEWSKKPEFSATPHHNGSNHTLAAMERYAGQGSVIVDNTSINTASVYGANPSSFRSVRYIPPLKLVENEFEK